MRNVILFGLGSLYATCICVLAGSCPEKQRDEAAVTSLAEPVLFQNISFEDANSLLDEWLMLDPEGRARFEYAHEVVMPEVLHCGAQRFGESFRHYRKTV